MICYLAKSCRKVFYPVKNHHMMWHGAKTFDRVCCRSVSCDRIYWEARSQDRISYRMKITERAKPNILMTIPYIMSSKKREMIFHGKNKSRNSNQPQTTVWRRTKETSLLEFCLSICNGSNSFLTFLKC